MLSALVALFAAAGAQAEGQTNAAKPAAAHDARASAGMSAAKSDQRVIDSRPEDPTANLPSDSGAHTELPTGAVTGAGLAHGTIAHPDACREDWKSAHAPRRGLKRCATAGLRSTRK